MNEFPMKNNNVRKNLSVFSRNPTEMGKTYLNVSMCT